MEKRYKDFYDINVEVNEDEIINICLNTLEQSKSNEWFLERAVRISASIKAHKVKTNRNRNKNLDDLAR